MVLAFIGGGASGMAAAIAAKRACPKLSVALLEKNPRVGKKLLATGNGQCNLLNRSARLSRYHGADPGFILPAMERFDFEALCRFFRSIGISITEKEKGKCYPRSLQAASVLDALRLECDLLQVETFCGLEVTSLRMSNGGWAIQTPEKGFWASRVILAAGNAASPKLGGSDSGLRLLSALGHRTSPLLPSIVQLKTDTTYTKALSGVKFEGIASLYSQSGRLAAKEEGEILFADYGLSGPAILNLSGKASRMLQKKDRPFLSLDLLPEIGGTELFALLKEQKKVLAQLPLEHFLSGIVNKRLGQTALKAAGIGPFQRLAETLTNQELSALCGVLKGWEFSVKDTNGLTNAQVTAGGALTGEFDPQTMESKLFRGLYACGEVLDIDGDCGGFNLQWAWASGLTAGSYAAQSLKEEEKWK